MACDVLGPSQLSVMIRKKMYQGVEGSRATVRACKNVSSAPLNRNTTGADSRTEGFSTSTRASSSSTPTQEAQSEAPASDQLSG